MARRATHSAIAHAREPMPVEEFVIVDHPDGVEVNGVFFEIDFEEMHRQAEEDEAAGRYYDWEDVKKWSKRRLAELRKKYGT